MGITLVAIFIRIKRNNAFRAFVKYSIDISYHYYFCMFTFETLKDRNY